MITSLVGYTGFVGSNLASIKKFTNLYNSKNIAESYGTKPDLLVYCGLPAAKFLANTAPERDREICVDAYENICKIAPKELVLISTVDVYKSPCAVDENSALDLQNQAAYGKNRAELEALVHQGFEDALIIRLPGLFGGGLKKNFIYDMLTVIPSMLKAEKYEELCKESTLVSQAYTDAGNGFYALNEMETAQRESLKLWFSQNSFNALSFTDSRAEYQFYNLSSLWRDIAWAKAANLKLINFNSQPVSAAEIYAHVTKGGVFKNELSQPVVKYDMRTKYFALFEGENGYMLSKADILDEIAAFMRRADY